MTSSRVSFETLRALGSHAKCLSIRAPTGFLKYFAGYLGWSPLQKKQTETENSVAIHYRHRSRCPTVPANDGTFVNCSSTKVSMIHEKYGFQCFLSIKEIVCNIRGSIALFYIWHIYNNDITNILLLVFNVVPFKLITFAPSML